MSKVPGAIRGLFSWYGRRSGDRRGCLNEGAGLKTIQVSPELIAEMLDKYTQAHPEHIEGKISLEIQWNSWRAFEKKVGQ